MQRTEEKIRCKICGRLTPLEYVERHHLVPKSRKGKDTIIVCRSCGSQVHKLFSNKKLAKLYNNLDAILADERIQKWIKWIRNKPNDFGVCMATKKRRK